MYDFVEKSMQSELWRVYKTIRSYQNMPKRPTLKPGRKRPSRKPMFNECATSAFQRQGSDRYIGHWSLLPRRATEPIAASLILNIAISEPRLITSRKFGPRSGPTKSLKLIKPDGFSDFFYHTLILNLHVKT